MEARYASRLKKVQQQIKKESFDALLVRSKSNILYLSGYPSGEAYALITPDESYLFVDFIYEEDARASSHNMKIIRVDKSMALSLEKVLKKTTVRRIGFEANHIYFSSIEAIRRQCSGFRFVARTRLIEKIRMFKDDDELNKITQAIVILEQGLKKLLEMPKTGLSEKKIKRDYENILFELGADETSFDTITASGANASRPHAVAGKDLAASGIPLLVDSGIKFKNYCSDLTRTMILHNINQDFSRLYDIVYSAQQKAIEAIRPGLKISELDAVARDYIGAHGYADNFGHSLGHGVGLDVHEEPRVTCGNEEPLQPGMVITVEPGIYIPGAFGIRIEDMVVVTDDGCRVLSSFPKNLDAMLTA